jgi:hypothetical protein
MGMLTESRTVIPDRVAHCFDKVGPKVRGVLFDFFPGDSIHLAHWSPRLNRAMHRQSQLFEESIGFRDVAIRIKQESAADVGVESTSLKPK